MLLPAEVDTDRVGLLASLDRTIERLSVLDDRVLKRPAAASSETPDVASARGRWRQRPYLRWFHGWTRADVMALIMMVAGLLRAIPDLTDSHLLSGFAWLGLTVGGVALFLLASLFPD